MHIRHAMAAIAAGMCSVALASRHAAFFDGSRKSGAVAASRPAGRRAGPVAPYGQLSPIGYYAMVAHWHMHRYGTTPRTAEVAVAARRWAELNPAVTGEPTSIDEVMASPVIARIAAPAIAAW